MSRYDARMKKVDALKAVLNSEVKAPKKSAAVPEKPKYKPKKKKRNKSKPIDKWADVPVVSRSRLYGAGQSYRMSKAFGEVL